MRNALVVALGLFALGTAEADPATTLAREQVGGTVLVDARASLYATRASATAASAQAAAGKPAAGPPVAMRVVADRGAIIELTTAPSADCYPGFEAPYRLTVFVPRIALVPRASTDISKTFGDGTAVAIDRGAAVAIGPSGPTWTDPLLAATGVPPRADQLRYGIAKPGHAALAPATGDRLVCDPGPMTVADWRKHRDEQRVREQRARDDERARKRQQQAHPAPRPHKSSDSLQDQADQAAAFADLLASDQEPAGRLGVAFEVEPWCGARDETGPWDRRTKVAEPTLDGRAIPWLLWTTIRNDQVTQSGAAYLADLELRCGRVRIAIAAPGIAGGGGSASIGGGRRREWTPKPGPVSWPDGTPAGAYTGTNLHYTDDQIEDHGKLVCVHVGPVAEPVCHRRSDMTITP